MEKIVKMFLAMLILTFNSLAMDSFIENGWKNIKPLKNNKKTVEKIMGLPKNSKDGYYNYETEDFFAQMNYTTAPCKENNLGRGDYTVSEDTVLDYNIILHNQIKLSNLKFQRKKYRQSTESKMSGSIYYLNSDSGIMISTEIKDGIEYVGEIRFYPSSTDEKRLECKTSKLLSDKNVKKKTEKIQAVETKAKIKFSSVYTNLGSEACKSLSKPSLENPNVPYLCNGYKNYKIYVDTSGKFYIGREITKDVKDWANLELPSFLIGLDEEVNIEWRLANGEPFACIVRIRYDKKSVNPNEGGRANEFFVRNLRGFASIDIKIDTYYNERAEEEARNLADKGYRKL